jgi:GTP-binding protein
VDKQLTEYVLESYKPVIFVVNKWDLTKASMPTEKMANYVRAMFPMLDYVPIAFITATKGKNVLRLLQLAVQLHKQAGARASTGDLNRAVRAAIDANPPPLRNNRQAKVFYATQIGVYPPTIVLFTNGPELFDDTYVRYLTKALRDTFPYSEVAIKVVLRARNEGGGWRQDETTEEMEALPKPDEDMPPIIRKRGRVQHDDDEPIESPPDVPKPKKRKKKPGADTWDF